jgi:hypothetical protein
VLQVQDSKSPTIDRNLQTFVRIIFAAGAADFQNASPVRYVSSVAVIFNLA